MTYTPKPGDIGLVKIPGAGGKVIRALQWANGTGFADYEHAFMVVSNDPYGDSPPEIIEAEPTGARITALWYDTHRVRWLVCPDRLRADVAMYGRACEHTPYSWADYGACGLHRMHVDLPGLRHYIETSRHMMCSQLVDHAAMRGGWHLFDDERWEGYVTPGHLNGLWVKHHALHDGMAA